LENKQTNGCLNVTRRQWIKYNNHGQSRYLRLTTGNPTNTLSMLQAAEKTISLDPENQDGGL